MAVKKTDKVAKRRHATQMTLMSSYNKISHKKLSDQKLRQ